MPSVAPEPTEPTLPPAPWAEVAARVTGPAAVLGGGPEIDDDLPAGWHRAGPGNDRADGPVVLLAPLDPDDVTRAHRLAGAHPLVVVLPNLARPALLRALLVGRGDDVVPGPARAALTRSTVDRLAAAAGRRPVNDAAEPQPVPTGRPLDDLLAQLGRQAGGHDRPWLVRSYLPAGPAVDVRAGLGSEAPFLSVLVRTQGRRDDALADVLLCLAAQTCDDFEVLLLAHDVDDGTGARLRSLLAQQPAALRARADLVPVSGGGRVRPLTVGVARARGRYLAVLDDDDLVLASWVAAFRDAAAAQPGSVARSVTVEQHVEVDGRGGYRASSWPHARWDREFSLLSHLVDNHTPVHAYALPREVFSDLGMSFDESLPVLEDWDLLVRAATLLGVRDSGEVTAVYRRWPHSTSSFAEVAETDWPDTAWRVVGAWDESPLLLPAGSARRLREEGIYVLRHPPLRVRAGRRLDRWQDRWSGTLMRTPLWRPARWAYRRLRDRTGAAA